MTEMNARTLMFNLGPIDSTTLVKIARYADRKQLTYKITKKGTLLLDGRGKKIHLRKGVVTLRNALDLHALPERVVSRYRIDDFRNDNIVLATDPNLTKQTNMLHVRKMALVPTTASVVEPADIVGTLPKTLQMKGRQLLSAVTWNERGELIHKGVAIRGSNAVDLVHDLLRNRKTPDPVGWQQFANQMRAANIPMELVGNVTRRLYLQKKRGKRTPQKRTPETEWETL